MYPKLFGLQVINDLENLWLSALDDTVHFNRFMLIKLSDATRNRMLMMPNLNDMFDARYKEAFLMVSKVVLFEWKTEHQKGVNSTVTTGPAEKMTGGKSRMAGRHGTMMTQKLGCRVKHR